MRNGKNSGWEKNIIEKQDAIANIKNSNDYQTLFVQITMAAKLGSRTPEEDKLGSQAPKPPR